MSRSADLRRMTVRKRIRAAARSEEGAQVADRRGWRGRLLDLLRHPLFLLLMSSVLVSGVGRLYNDYSEQVRVRAERREKLSALIVEMRYRTLLIARANNELLDVVRDFVATSRGPGDQKALAKALDPFSSEPVDPGIAARLDNFEARFKEVQPAMLAVIRGETGASDPQFAKVHAAALASRIELLAGLPLQRFEQPAPNMPSWVEKREVGILSALMNLEQNLLFDPSAYHRAIATLTAYVDVRERNYADDILPVEKGEAVPASTDYLDSTKERPEP